MTTTTSYIKSKASVQIYLGTLRRGFALAVFYTLLLFTMFPLLYLLSVQGGTNDFFNSTYLMGLAGIYNPISLFALPLIFAVTPIVVGLLNFSFLHKKAATDVFHALPIKRANLFSSTYLAGLTVLWVPIILSFAFIFVIGVPAPSISSAFMDLIGWLTIAAAIYSITAAVAVLSSNSFDSTLFSIAFCAMYPIIILVILTSMQVLLLGSDSDWMKHASNLLLLSPFTLMLTRTAQNPRQWGTEIEYLPYVHLGPIAIFVWLAIAAALFFIARYFYTRRKSELAGRTITRSALTTTAKYIFTLVCGGIFGLIFSATFDDKPMYLVGTLIGGIIAYIGVEAVVARGFKTFPKAFLQMLIPVGLVTALGAILLTGGLGWSQYVPATEDIVEVSINYNGIYGRRHILNTDKGKFPRNELTELEKRNSVKISSQEGIEAIRAMHTATISEQLSLHNRNSMVGSTNFYPRVVYTLKNGKKISREYDDISLVTATLLAPLEDCEEYKQQTNPAFLFDVSDVSGIVILNIIGGKNYEQDLDTDKRKALLDALRTDFLAQKASDLTGRKYAELGFITLTVNPNGGSGRMPLVPQNNMLLITEQHTNTLRFLRENSLAAYLQAGTPDESNKGSYRVALTAAGYNDESFGYKIADFANFEYSDFVDKLDPDKFSGTGWINASDFVVPLFSVGYATAPIGSDTVLVHFVREGNELSNLFLFVDRAKLPPELLADLTAQQKGEEQSKNDRAALL